MSSPRASLQLTPHAAGFRRLDIVFQRIGYGLFAAVIVAAMGGLFGNGLFSKRVIASDGGSQLTYECIARRGGENILVISVGRQAGDELVVECDRRFMQPSQEEVRVSPMPLRIEAAPESLRYVFATAEGPEGVVIEFHLTPRAAGPLRGFLRCNGETLPVSQLILP